MNDSVDIARGKQLTEQFYAWEARGRGWLLAEEIVQLEPPFHPFFFHYVPNQYIDDGKRHTLLSKTIKFFKGEEEVPVKEKVPIIPNHTYIPYEPVSNTSGKEKPKEKAPVVNRPPIKRECIKPSIDDEATRKEEQSEHRYLQTLIKKMAEARGYTSSLEVPTANGGKVDVALEKVGKSIACEVSVTTDANWELHNIEKCLQAGYQTVVVCSKDQKSIVAINRKIKASITTSLQSRVQVLQPEELFQYLDSETVDKTPKETTIKGYRVKIKYETEGRKDEGEKAKMILNSLQKNISKSK